MKNYADRGGCFPPSVSASVDKNNSSCYHRTCSLKVMVFNNLRSGVLFSGKSANVSERGKGGRPA